MGLIVMYELDLQRTEVLSEATEGRMTIAYEAYALALCKRQVHRLLDVFDGEGA